MRLTVHVSNALKQISEEKTNDGFVKKTKIFTTLSFPDVSTPEDVDRILAEIESDGYGTPVKHYLSGERVSGKARGKKKA